jgi:hypothetical protein
VLKCSTIFARMKDASECKRTLHGKVILCTTFILLLQMCESWTFQNIVHDVCWFSFLLELTSLYSSVSFASAFLSSELHCFHNTHLSHIHCSKSYVHCQSSWLLPHPHAEYYHPFHPLHQIHWTLWILICLSFLERSGAWCLDPLTRQFRTGLFCCPVCCQNMVPCQGLFKNTIVLNGFKNYIH